MNELMNVSSNNEITMSSLDLLEIINNVRREFDEPEVRNNDFLKRIEDELDGELGITKVSQNPTGGRPKDYYDLTLEQCTLVGMRESKGVRRAVLSKLKELENQTPAYHLPTTFHEALRMLADESEKNLILENQIKDDLPYTSFAKKIENSSNAIPLGVYSKILKIKDLGPNNMIKFLRENGILIKSGRRKNCPLQKYMQLGWFEIKESTFKTPKGQQVIGFTTLITGSGQIEIAKKFGWNYPLDMD